MRQLAFRLAGLTWLTLGILAILTVFGTMLGLALAYLVGIRRNVTAARVGACLGVLLFIPCQLIIDVAGCRHDSCSAEPYLLAYGLPLVVTVLNLAAGWPIRSGAGPVSLASSGADGPAPPDSPPADAPVQQVIWEGLDAPKPS